MLHIEPSELRKREIAAKEAFAAQRGNPSSTKPTPETIHKLKLLADEVQLVAGELDGPEWSTAWSLATDAYIILRRSAEIVAGERDKEGNL